jgi:hypothetical protein
VERLLDVEGAAAAIVLGDDRSDAGAFRAVAAAVDAGRLRGALALGVHGAAETPDEIVAAADVVLPAPRDAARALSLLAGLLEREVVSRAARARPA